MMKLNIGCGGNYKKGYLNVDAFDSTVADQIMQAYDLKLDDNSFDEIYMSQLIEHLGIVGSIHSLSECFRVLKPEGILIIETPDLRRSFEKYLKGGREARKNTLPWIYGVDISGMIHRFCYPDDLLEETLQKIGYVDIQKDIFEIDQYEPVLKITCKKPLKYPAFQIMTTLRKNLLENDIIDLDDQITSLEKHDLVDLFSKETQDFLEKKDLNNLHKIICKGAIINPKITRLFLEELESKSIITKDFFNKYHSVLKILEDLDFSNILLKTMMKIEGFVGEQEKLYSTIDELALKTIEKILENESKEKTINKLMETSKLISSEDRIDFLSSKMIMLKSNRFFQIGIKEFALENYAKAIDIFRKSISLHRGQILAYWNLGRLQNLLGKPDVARSSYENAMKVLTFVDYENKEDIKKSLEQEINDKDVGKYSEPITSLKEL